MIAGSFSNKQDTSEAELSAIWKRILEIIEFTRQLKFGNELKIGIIIHSWEECVSIVENVPNNVLSQLDIAMYNEQHYRWLQSSVIKEREIQENGFEKCNQIFYMYFPQPPLHHVKEFSF